MLSPSPNCLEHLHSLHTPLFVQLYTREPVHVHPLSASQPLSSVPDSQTIVPSNPSVNARPELSTIASTHPPVEAHTYIWRDPVSDLSPEVWSFEEFVMHNARKWFGNAGAKGEDQNEGKN